MTLTNRTRIFLALLALLVLTRFSHFGSTVSLPDASLAVFLMGGLWLGRVRCFAAYMVTAFGIDVFLAKTAVEAGWCLTPAYGGLVLSYGVMWGAGRLLARNPILSPWNLAGIGMLAVAAAFVVSNASFWAFSGYFGQMGVLEYSSTVIQYLPPYLGSTALYLGLGWLIQRILSKQLPMLNA